MNKSCYDKKTGFSLLEMSIVLFLIALICILQFVPSSETTNKMAEEEFWLNFRQNWTSLVVRSHRQKTAGLALFLNHSVQFTSGTDTADKKQIALPKTMHVQGGKREEKIYANGGTQPQTIKINSDLGGASYNIIFELGFGGQYRVQKVKN